MNFLSFAFHAIENKDLKNEKLFKSFIIHEMSLRRVTELKNDMFQAVLILNQDKTVKSLTIMKVG